MFYSATTGGFYHPEIHADRPADAVEIPAALHARLLDGQAAGRPIVAGPDGRPKLAPIVRLSLAELRDRATGAAKAEAARRIELVAPMWRQLNAMRSSAGARDPIFAAIDAIRTASAAIEARIATLDRDGLRDLDITDPTHWPEGARP